MKKHIVIFPALVFNLILNINMSAQSTTVGFADNLYINQQYEYALKEYLRIYFLKRDHTSDLLLKISNLYSQLNQPEKSLKYADLYFFGNEDLNKKNDAIRTKILVFLKSKDYESALISANQLKEIDITSTDTKNFYTGLCHLLQKTPQIKDNELLLLSYLSEDDKKNLIKKLDNFQKVHLKNPYNAMFYSAIVPGLGQTLNGNLSDGLKSFMLMGTLGMIFIEVSQVLSFGDAIISVSPWMIRYFAGGMINASKQAKLKTVHEKERIITEIIQHLAQKKYLNSN
jgi:hypothetical protein